MIYAFPEQAPAGSATPENLLQSFDPLYAIILAMTDESGKKGKRTKTLLAWSCGKDSAYALSILRGMPQVEVAGLLTTINSSVGRVSMHGVHKSVLEAQARACGLPLHTVPLPDPCSNKDYEAAMADALRKARRDGIKSIAFGDIFLTDVRTYREERLAGIGIAPIFPLWGRSTSDLAREIINAGIEAIITCVDTEKLDRSFVGRRFDHQLLADLPAGVDMCGENGEFHTVVIAGPMFSRRLQVEVGEVVKRGRFVFADVILLEEREAGR